MPRKVLGQEAGTEVVVAADRMAADQPDLLAAIEVGLGGRNAGNPDRERDEQCPSSRNAQGHVQAPSLA